MVGKGHDPEGWGAMVDYMMGSMHYFLSERLQPQEVVDVKTYLNQLFGKNSVLPKSPEDHPKYKETVRNPFTDESLKIVYVTYEMPNRSSFPWTARYGRISRSGSRGCRSIDDAGALLL